MGGVDAVAGMDRLPWLSDERPAGLDRRRRNVINGWTAGVGFVSAAGLAVGIHSLRQTGSAVPSPRSVATVRLPAARPVPEAAPPQYREEKVGARSNLAERADDTQRVHKVADPAPQRPASTAAGLAVQIGAFGSAAQARRGLTKVGRVYPALTGLPASVRTARNSKGRDFYRFQLGTTSQAHSEVLCQRMREIALSCAVIGLPNRAGIRR